MKKEERIQAIEKIIIDFVEKDIYCDKCADGSVGIEGGIHIDKLATAIEEAIGVDEVEIFEIVKAVYKQGYGRKRKNEYRAYGMKNMIAKEISTNKEVITISEKRN